jgi:hypothetical protein
VDWSTYSVRGQSRPEGSNHDDEYDYDFDEIFCTFISMFQPQLHALKEPILHLIDLPEQCLFTTRF